MNRLVVILPVFIALVGMDGCDSVTRGGLEGGLLSTSLDERGAAALVMQDGSILFAVNTACEGEDGGKLKCHPEVMRVEADGRLAGESCFPGQTLDGVTGQITFLLDTGTRVFYGGHLLNGDDWDVFLSSLDDEGCGETRIDTVPGTDETAWDAAVVGSKIVTVGSRTVEGYPAALVLFWSLEGAKEDSLLRLNEVAGDKSEALAVAASDDGQLVLAGYRFDVGGNTGDDLWVAQVVGAGTRSFKDILVADSGGLKRELASAIVRTPLGLFVGGYATWEDEARPWIVEIQPDLTLAANAATDGVLKSLEGRIETLAADPRGGVFAGGRKGASPWLARFTATGTQDSDWGDRTGFLPSIVRIGQGDASRVTVSVERKSILVAGSVLESSVSTNGSRDAFLALETWK